jgi:hypothetical protein
VEGGSSSGPRGIAQPCQFGRDHDHNGPRFVLADDAGRLDSVHVRHVEIEQYEVRLQLWKEPDRFMARPDGADEAQRAGGQDDGGGGT